MRRTNALVTLGASGLLLAVVLTANACGGGAKQKKPAASLSSTPAAAGEMAEIRQAWNDAGGHGRTELKLKIQRFLSRFADDGAAPLARVYLAFLLVNDGDLAGAEREIALLEKIRIGATKDFAMIAKARLLRMRGRAGEALDLIAPLAGKVVDTDAMELFQEEITLDAVAARRDYEAIAYMDSWLRYGREEDRELARQKIPEALSKMSPQVLEASLRSMRTATRTAGNAGGYSLEMQRYLAAQLATYAIDTDNARLAQWLVDPDAGAPVLSVDAGVMVSELATQHRRVRQVSGRTIGLVLPTGTFALRDSAADVARGAAFALDLPRSTNALGDSVRLVTRDDGGRGDRIESVLDDVAGDGASTILVGLEPDQADRALAWAERSGVVIIALAAPRHTKPGRYGYVMGEPYSTSLDALSDALLARRETKIALVTDEASVSDVSRAIKDRPKLSVFQPAPCDVSIAATSSEGRFPVAAWEKAGFRTWLVSGSQSCARDVVREVGELRGALIALTLQAGTLPERNTAAKVLAASAGSLPVRLNPDAGTGDPAILRYNASFGAIPTWFTALGHDAALLARQAVSALPTDTTSDSKQVTARRDQVRAALDRARGPLWTSEKDAIDPQTHTISRSVRVIELR
jgi:ABC-type branched-subunit amino acid transport system substrate-binding protein